MYTDLVKMNLQMFSDEETKEVDPKLETKDEDKVSISEMQRRLALEKTKYQKEIQELKDQQKKNEMSEEQKISYEQEQLQLQNKELSDKLKTMESKNVVISKLTEKELFADDSIMDLIVSPDQDQSLKNTDALVAYIDKVVNARLKESARQELPKSGYEQPSAKPQKSRTDAFRSKRKI